MSLLAITSSVLHPSTELHTKCIQSWERTRTTQHEVCLRENTLEDNLGVTGSLQWCYEHTKAPIIAFFHSDTELLEQGWDVRVLAEFDDPTIGVVGFGGALQLGENDIYRTPYKLSQLSRIHYMSNQSDIETHGTRETGACDVATLDGFAMIVRRQLLDNWRHNFWQHYGWPVERYPFHNYDNRLCIEAANQGFRVRLVGVACQHYGGATSTTAPVQEYWKSLGTSDQEIHTKSHEHLYEDGRGWLPLRARTVKR